MIQLQRVMKKVMTEEVEYRGICPACGLLRVVLRTLDIRYLGGFTETNNRLRSAEHCALIRVFETSLRLVWRTD